MTLVYLKRGLLKATMQKIKVDISRQMSKKESTGNAIITKMQNVDHDWPKDTKNIVDL